MKYTDELYQQRSIYLSALGLQSWSPRYQLPGAKPSCLSTPDHEKELATEPSKDLFVKTNKTTVKISKDTTPPTAEHSSALQTPKPANTNTTPPFTLQFLHIPYQCWIINELPQANAYKTQSRDHQYLVINLLKALRLDPERWQEWRFHWPIAPDLDKKTNAIQANDSVSAFFATQVAQNDDTQCHIFMGRHANKFFPMPDKKTEKTQQNMPYKAHTLLSIDELLRIPDGKQQTWHDLKWLTRKVGRTASESSS